MREDRAGDAAGRGAASERTGGSRSPQPRASEPASPPDLAVATGEASSEGATSAVYLPPFRIDVTVRPRVPIVVSKHRLAAAVRAALEAAGAPGPASIAVVLSDDAELTGLNVTHMGVSGATDVLSFPFFPGEAFPPHERATPVERNPGVAAALRQAFAVPPGMRPHLGDVIVSVERAIAQAAAGRGGQTGDVRWTAVEEVLLLAVHGTLHVCGWDHAEPVEEAAMRELEREVLAALETPGIETPGIETPGTATPGTATPGIETREAETPRAES